MMEDLTDAAEARLREGPRQPTGVNLDQTMDPACMQRDIDLGAPFGSEPFACITFADETYVAANTTTGLEYALSTLADTLEPAGQLSHGAKCEVMTIDDIATDPPRVWTQDQRRVFFRTRARPG